MKQSVNKLTSEIFVCKMLNANNSIFLHLRNRISEFLQTRKQVMS